MYAHMLDMVEVERSKSQTREGGVEEKQKHIYIPLINTARADLPLRKDTLFLFEWLGVDIGVL